MSPLIETVAVIAPIVLVCVLAVYASFVVWQASASDNPVLLGEMLGRQGADTLRLAVASGGHDFARAVRQCGSCGEMAQCRSWLESGRREGYEAFCPNAGYVERVAGLTATR
jgi:hypothetical protein